MIAIAAPADAPAVRVVGTPTMVFEPAGDGADRIVVFSTVVRFDRRLPDSGARLITGHDYGGQKPKRILGGGTPAAIGMPLRYGLCPGDQSCLACWRGRGRHRARRGAPPPTNNRRGTSEVLISRATTTTALTRLDLAPFSIWRARLSRGDYAKQVRGVGAGGRVRWTAVDPNELPPA